MPTARDYFNYTARLRGLASELEDVVRPSQLKLPPARLTGGLLAAKVEEAIERRATDSRTYAEGIQRLADECKARADLALDLDVAWYRYDRAYDVYLTAIDEWEVARDLYVADPFASPHPGPPPEAPIAPSTNPDWYDRSMLEVGD